MSDIKSFNLGSPTIAHLPRPCSRRGASSILPRGVGHAIQGVNAAHQSPSLNSTSPDHQASVCLLTPHLPFLNILFHKLYKITTKTSSSTPPLPQNILTSFYSTPTPHLTHPRRSVPLCTASSANQPTLPPGTKNTQYLKSCAFSLFGQIIPLLLMVLQIITSKQLLHGA